MCCVHSIRLTTKQRKHRAKQPPKQSQRPVSHVGDEKGDDVFPSLRVQMFLNQKKKKVKKKKIGKDTDRGCLSLMHILLFL